MGVQSAPMTRDGPSGSTPGPGTPDSVGVDYWITDVYTELYHMHVHTGRFVFGTLDESTGEGLKFNDDETSIVLNNYDPSLGVGAFECPFISYNRTGKGGLSNWFAGCEPTSYILSRLLGGKIFYGFPYLPALGYSFRGAEIPKLVFVFTNEFDNEICRTDTEADKTNSVVAIPRKDGDAVGLDALGLMCQSIFKPLSSDGYPTVGDSGGAKCGTVLPTDPYCV